MRIAEINIPKGCNKVYVDLEDDNKVVITYGPNFTDKEFPCQLTGEVETRPSVGDFSIFWNKEERASAICANFDNMEKEFYCTSNGLMYDEAVKFRDYNQYLQIRGIHED